jgi:hypothetical protein
MNNDLLGFVLAKLDLREPAWTDVARGAGVPYDTLKKIATRRTPNPGVQHVQRLADFFAGRESPGTTGNGEPAHEAGLPPHGVERRDPARISAYAGTDIDRRAPVVEG